MVDWKGFIPPQYIVRAARFKKVVLDPPSFEPGSWVGAGRVFYDHVFKEYLMAVRPRRPAPARGVEVRIYSSKNGEDFYLKTALTKEDISRNMKTEVLSIEGVQIIRDPLTDLLYLYVSVDYRQAWETILYVSDDPAGPWEYKGFVLKTGEPYDAKEARDVVVDIIDGTYFMFYKAQREVKNVKAGLAISHDGIHWKKLGTPTIDGEKQPDYFQLNGNFFACARGVLFMGLARRYLINGCGIAKHFEAYIVDYRNCNLETIYRTEWKATSPYERKDWPTHGYSSIVFDYDNNRVLIYIESIDPKYTKEVGWATQVDRWILYEAKLPES